MKSLQTQKKEEMIDGNGHEVMTISQIAHMIKNIFTKKMWLPFLQNIFNEMAYFGVTDISF